MFAALPWYELPETRSALLAFWRGWTRHAGLERIPLQLQAPLYEPLHRPDLLLTQTCGLVAGQPEFPAAVVASPVFQSAGCEGACYRSVLLSRQGLSSLDEGLRACINDPLSHSGCTALRELAPSTRQTRVTGSHERSVQLLATGEADLAAVDGTTWALLQRHRPGLCRGLVEHAWSQPAPAPPWVSRPEHLERLRAALRAWLADPDSLPICEQLHLKGAEVLPEEAYTNLYERSLTSTISPS